MWITYWNVIIIMAKTEFVEYIILIYSTFLTPHAFAHPDNYMAFQLQRIRNFRYLKNSSNTWSLKPIQKRSIPQITVCAELKVSKVKPFENLNCFFVDWCVVVQMYTPEYQCMVYMYIHRYVRTNAGTMFGIIRQQCIEMGATYTRTGRTPPKLRRTRI